MTPAEIIAREVGKMVDAELDRTDGQRVPLYGAVIGTVEKPLFDAALRHHNGNQSHAALALGLSRNTLKKKMREYGIR